MYFNDATIDVLEMYSDFVLRFLMDVITGSVSVKGFWQEEMLPFFCKYHLTVIYKTNAFNDDSTQPSNKAEPNYEYVMVRIYKNSLFTLPDLLRGKHLPYLE